MSREPAWRPGSAAAALRAVKDAARDQKEAKLKLAREAAQRVVLAAQAAVEKPAPKKLRKRPRALAEAPPSPAKATAWNCRPAGRHIQRKRYTRPPRRAIALGLRKTVLRIAQGPLCGLCGQPRPNDTLDHVYPLSGGGRDLLGNVMLACGVCNGTKGADDPTGCELVWLAFVNDRLFDGVEEARRSVQKARARERLPRSPRPEQADRSRRVRADE